MENNTNIPNTEGWEEMKGNTNLWLPEKEGDFIEGDITELVNGQYGYQATIKTKDKIIVTPSHKVLQSRLVDCKVGDYVKIIFVREELPTMKGRQGTKIYQVLRKKQ